MGQEEQNTVKTEEQEKRENFKDFFNDDSFVPDSVESDQGSNNDGGQEGENNDDSSEDGTLNKVKTTTAGGNDPGDGGDGGDDDGASVGDNDDGSQEGASTTDGDDEDGAGTSADQTVEQNIVAFEKYMQKFDQDYKVPDSVKNKENLTNEDLFSTFEQEVFKKKEQDPFIKNYLLRKDEEGFDMSSYINENKEVTDILNTKDNKEFLKQIYKKNGQVRGKEYTDEQIEEHINTMSAIQIDEQADRNRDQLKKNLDDYYNSQNEKIQQFELKKLKDLNKQNNEQIDNFLKEVDAKKRSLPVDMEQKEYESFVKDAKKLVEIDEKTGTNLISELLNDDDFFMDILPFIYKRYAGTLKNYNLDLKQKVKDKIKKNLRPGVDQQSRSSGTSKQAGVTAKNFFDNDE
jgi:hypothetical protein